eukprot:Anaeramoba_ignava/a482697_59.p3 GENE.a482697_59~~a482697_59.p3  ORF type:complete len:258 (+),score=7.87 a482697_59:2664-3437(+)
MEELYNKEEKKVEIKQNYTAAYIAGFTAVLLAVFLGYTYYANDMVKKGDLDKKYMKKDDITFQDLPAYLQSDYISKFEHNQQLSRLNQQISELGSKNKAGERSYSSVNDVEKVIEVEKIVEVEKPVTIVKTIENIDKTKYKSYGCYEMVSGDYYSSQNCIDKLHDFLDKNKDAKLFEVIGVYNSEEFDVAKKIGDEQERKELKRVFDLAQVGLVEKRVVEGIWQIKNHLGFSTNVRKVNYEIKSQYGLKGFVVRAYQ